MNKKLRKYNKKLSKFSTVNIGGVCLLEDCCREIRLGGLNIESVNPGYKLCGFNTLTDSYEEWELVKINKDNYYKSLVKRLI